MKIKEIIQFLETVAPTAYQESYDNCGLIAGQNNWDCTGILTSLDCTEVIVDEAIAKGCNLIVAHHPIVFKGLKKLNGNNYVERTIIKAIKNDIAIFAIHTNLDSMPQGVNAMIAAKIGLQKNTLSILAPKANSLCKLITFTPTNSAEMLRQALFAAGAGHIGNYDLASFNLDGLSTYRANEGANPALGNINEYHHEAETRIEVIFPAQIQHSLVATLIKAHPYEEVAYDIVPLANENPFVGAGMIGALAEPMEATDFLALLQEQFHIPVIKHTALSDKPIQKVAVCGGAGSFLTQQAIRAGADIYVTADVKYHEFFDADNQIIIADIGHFESEQYTRDLLADVLIKKFPNFAILKSDLCTNPISYFTGK